MPGTIKYKGSSGQLAKREEVNYYCYGVANDRVMKFMGDRL